MKGRRVIYTDVEVLTRDNVIAVVNRCMQTHLQNRTEIQTLYDYYRGQQNIENKTKEVREEINNKVMENRCYEIANFYEGYVFGEPIQYVRRENAKGSAPDKKTSEDINMLNSYMQEANKPAVDSELAQWLYVAGHGYRLTLPNSLWDKSNKDEPPFEVYSLDPRNTFVAYSTWYDKHPVFDVMYSKLEDGGYRYTVHTRDLIFMFETGVLGEDSGVMVMPNPLGELPIIEYPANTARLGVFENLLSLQDALNQIDSDQIDDIEQFVNSFLALIGGDMDKETWDKVQAYKTLCLPDGVDAKYIGKQMNETTVKNMRQDIVQSMYEISGVPDRMGSSLNSTGASNTIRNGWTTSDARAKAVETMFKKSEKTFLTIVLKILRDTVGTKLTVKDIETHFTRRNYENIVSKAQVLVQMLSCDKIEPELAFTYCGMFIDPEAAYMQSKAYYESVKAEQQTTAKRPKEVADGNQQDTGRDKVSSVPEEAPKS